MGKKNLRIDSLRSTIQFRTMDLTKKVCLFKYASLETESIIYKTGPREEEKNRITESIQYHLMALGGNGTKAKHSYMYEAA